MHACIPWTPGGSPERSTELGSGSPPQYSQTTKL